MAKIDFDKIVNRKNTSCAKYDGLGLYFKFDEKTDIKDVDPLWVADMDFAIPKNVEKSLAKKLKQKTFGYEINSQDFFEAVISWQKKNKITLEKENITFVNGVVPAISAAIKAFSEVGDKVIIQPPVYFPFFSTVTQNDRELVTNPLKYENGKYSMDLEDLESKLDEKTKMLILCSPHNPVGRVWSKKELQKLVEICQKHNIIIVSDEIHSDIVFTKFTSIVNVAKKNTIVLNAPSKTFNVAGFNSAYGFSFDEELFEKFKDEVKKSHFYSMNSFSNVIISSCYSKKSEIWLDELLKYVEKNIAFTHKYFQKHLPKIKVVKSEATYLLWLDFQELGLKHKDIRYRLLNNAKVALNDGISFGKEGDMFFRINIALPKSKLKEALAKIVAEFKED